MKIAVPITENVVDDHFGHCEEYMVFTIDENSKVITSELLPSPQGCGCKSNIATILKEKEVNVMLAGNMGRGALNVLSKHGIQVYRGCSGDVYQLISTFIKGNIRDSGESCDQHEKDGHSHVCHH